MKRNLVRRTYLTCPLCSFRKQLDIPADFCLIAHRCASFQKSQTDFQPLC